MRSVDVGPQINDATVRLLTLLRDEVLIPNDTGCCGTLTFHMGERRQSRKLMGHGGLAQKTEGDGLDVIVLNTGWRPRCINYEYLFRHDPKIAEKAKSGRARGRGSRTGVGQIGGLPSPITMPVPTAWSAYKNEPVRCCGSRLHRAIVPERHLLWKCWHV